MTCSLPASGDYGHHRHHRHQCDGRGGPVPRPVRARQFCGGGCAGVLAAAARDAQGRRRGWAARRAAWCTRRRHIRRHRTDPVLHRCPAAHFRAGCCTTSLCPAPTGHWRSPAWCSPCANWWLQEVGSDALSARLDELAESGDELVSATLLETEPARGPVELPPRTSPRCWTASTSLRPIGRSTVGRRPPGRSDRVCALTLSR